VEVLIALTLATTVLTALFALFDNVSDVGLHIRGHIAQSRAMRTVFGVLEDDLRSLEPMTYGPVLASMSQADFSQDKVLVSMLTTATLAPDRPPRHMGVQLVEYLLRGSGNDRRLVRTERPFAHVNGNFDPTEVVLARGHVEADMHFFDPSYHEFRDDWDPSSMGNTPPTAVRMRLTLGGEDSEQEYELVVPLFSGI